ncbi:MAG: hypothetical protein M3R13_06150 [Armatimonadota bacterium]|nr:hypothetical protein [Armatimonadota bacterium]
MATMLGCTEGPLPAATPTVTPAELTLQIDLDPAAKAIRFTLHNGSRDPVIVPTRQPELIAYLLRGGEQVPITWDASNADMGRLDPFGCVLLQAGDAFERSLPLWTNLSGEIKSEEQVIGVTPRITIQSFDVEQQKQFARYKQYFLGKELRSPQITVSKGIRTRN